MLSIKGYFQILKIPGVIPAVIIPTLNLFVFVSLKEMLSLRAVQESYRYFYFHVS